MCKCANKEKNFDDSNNRINIKHRCVALLYALFINDLNVEVRTSSTGRS